MHHIPYEQCIIVFVTLLLVNLFGFYWIVMRNTVYVQNMTTIFFSVLFFYSFHILRRIK